MGSARLSEELTQKLAGLKDQGLYKYERAFASPQGGEIHNNEAGHEKSWINLCANNYLGLASDQRLITKAHQALDEYGYGMASVRFICGTQDIHLSLEAKLSSFLSMQDTILFSSCFDANTGLFESFLDEQDAIISDQLNHASIIDGIRLCKAQRWRYKNNDMAHLELCLKEAAHARHRLIATDGVFSMDGTIANLPEIVALAEKYDALVMVDESHAVGFIGENGAGTPEHYGLQEKIDILTGTLGKALGGASGGYVSGPKPLIDWLRQKARPYLFSNSLAPVISATSDYALDLIQSSEGAKLRADLTANANYFREQMAGLGFKLLDGNHPIIPIMLGDAKLAGEMANQLYQKGVYVTAFSYPVVPMGQARIRTQMSAGLSKNMLDRAIEEFASVGKNLNLIP